jgi:ppGpp synthetase/RelA/SpoT-type nucleotidyltranferase
VGELLTSVAKAPSAPGTTPGSTPPGAPPQTPSGVQPSATSQALKKAPTQAEIANGLAAYKNLTAKDFASASDPRLLAIRQLADKDNRQVAQALRAALEARGIKGVEIQQRTKSAASILGKLQEKPNVKISDIKDLSGIRINIAKIDQPGFKQHQAIVEVIKEVVQANKIKDYNVNPNEWGYTGRVHVFTESPHGISSEIQVGSRELSQFIETQFRTASGAHVEVHDLTGYKGQLYGKALPQPLQERYTQLIGEIGRANGAGQNAADVPALKAQLDAFRHDVQEFLTGPSTPH